MSGKAKDLQDLIKFTFNNPKNEKRILDLFIIDEKLASAIKTQTGVETQGFYVSIDNYSILHTLKKHGDQIKEEPRGQVAVQLEDFSLIPDAVTNCDSIELSNTKFQGKEVLIFKKVINNEYIVRMECRKVSKKNKTNRIVLLTLFIRKK